MKTAYKLQSMGRNGDTLLAHINPQEAHLLKSVGGSGTKNPKTGLLEFSFGDGIQADPGDPNSGGGTYEGGGYGGPDLAAMMALDAQLAPNYAQAPAIGAAPAPTGPTKADIAKALLGGLPGMIGLGIQAYNNRDWSNNTSFDLPGTQVSTNPSGTEPPGGLTNQPGGLLGTNPTTPPVTATPYAYNRPAFTPTFGQLRTANFTNPYSRRSGLLGG